MGTPGPQKVARYELEFKLKAVQMSQQPGVLVQDVAHSLCIHPFMLSKWRKQVRDGVLKGKLAPVDVAAVGELRRLRELEHKYKYKRLQVEHDILKKAIRFASELKAKSSPSLKQTGKPGRSR
jgi:transposase